MRDQRPVPLGAPDTYALRRRVLLAGVMSLVMFLTAAYFIAWLSNFEGTYDAWLLIAIGLIYLLVTRPLMRPVRDAIKLRRRLAYEAWLDERPDRDPGPEP